VDSQDIRWSLPDLEQAAARCKERNAQHIHVIFADLGEYAREKEQAASAVANNVAALETIYHHSLDASLSLKLSALGILFDENLFQTSFSVILKRAAKYRIAVEIDMEARGLVETILSIATRTADQGFPLTVSLQAYLDRSGKDLSSLLGKGIRIRLVKGAYHGDSEDFTNIQDRFKSLFGTLLSSERPFSVGTHDPDLIAWIEAQARESMDLLEIGFLMGLADETKVVLASRGWRVAEYVPFGEHGAAYQARREWYVTHLEELGRFAVP
jgi:proline dehydrogenase